MDSLLRRFGLKCVGSIIEVFLLRGPECVSRLCRIGDPSAHKSCGWGAGDGVWDLAARDDVSAGRTSAHMLLGLVFPWKAESGTLQRARAALPDLTGRSTSWAQV